MKAIKYVLIAGAVVFLLANPDFRNLVRNYLELGRMKKQERKIDKEYFILCEEKARLLNDKDDYLERTARKELNLTKPGELEFRFPPPRKQQ